MPAEQIVSSYLSITFEKATPEDIELGHMTFKVDKEWLEQNSIHKWTVALSWYDPELEQWVSLPTKRVREDDLYVYYTSVIPRFSIFAISGSLVVPPLKFKATSLVISPTKVKVGKEVTISADITNLSNTAGTYVATLWIDGTIEAGKDITIEAGETVPVSFTVTRDVEGSYQVRIDRLMGSFEVIPPVPPLPAKFVLSDLTIIPEEVMPGQPVTISAVVINIGEVEGSYKVTLKIDGVPVATEKVTLGGGKSTEVVFSVTRDVAATYQVEVDGLFGKFTVVPVPFPWWWIVIGVVVVGLLVYFLVIRRRIA